MRAIDADALLKKDEWLTWDGDSYNVIHVTDVFCAPTLDVEPVRHGRWIERSDKDIISMTHPYVCNLCGRVEMMKEPYCNCGAKMDLPN